MTKSLTIEQYFEKISRFAGDSYGKMVRDSFGDDDGSAELAMLASPTERELAQLKRAVSIMTAREKANAADLTDQQVENLAGDAGVDPAVLAIFINGYSLYCKRVL